jgi:hypothetical protein
MSISNKIRGIFVVTHESEYGKSYAAATDGAQVPVFVTPQTFSSFPVMTLVISGCWASLKRLDSDLTSPWVAVVLSILAGTVILLISVSDPGSKPKSTSKWFIAIVIALFNSLMLAASVLGVLQMASGTKN